MSKLVMTPGEILRSFKQAESKSKQVGILAELNATSREVIIDVLKEQGVHWRELTRAHSATSTDKKKGCCKGQGATSRARSTGSFFGSPRNIRRRAKRSSFVRSCVLQTSNGTGSRKGDRTGGQHYAPDRRSTALHPLGGLI